MTESRHEYDLVVLGGGVGGYVAAVRASMLGMKTALVEKDKLGGTCLHRGCIPTKALLRAAEVYALVRTAGTFGVSVSDVSFDFGRAVARATEIVERLHGGLNALMRKHAVDVYRGTGRLAGPSIFAPLGGDVAVEREDGSVETLVPRRLVIATGARPKTISGLEPDGIRILTSDDALKMDRLPSSVLIVGGGAIGVEWASMLSDFGVPVTIVEIADRLLPTEDEDVSAELARQFRKRGVRLLLNAELLPETLDVTDEGVRIVVRGAGGSRTDVAADRMLVCVGRQANLDGIGLHHTQVKIRDGRIETDGFMRTADPRVYAVGDVVLGPQLAHAASHAAIVAVDHMAGLDPLPVDWLRVPRCVYGRPEVAAVGMTERQARESGRNVRVGRFPFAALGKALAHGESGGFVKAIADADSGDLLGVHAVGPAASELIAEASLAKWLDATPWEIGYAVRPHPSFSEALAEAMWTIDGRAIHL